MSRFRIPGVRRSACLWLATALAMLLAAPAKALGLAEAVRQGLAFHLAVAAARAELAAARTETGIARDGYWPTVQAAAGPENALWGELGYEVTASLMLYDWGRVRSRVERASAVERQRLHALKAAAEQAALDIVEAYLDVLLFEARVAAVERHIGRVVELAAHGGERVARGYADRGEAERAVLELARAREQRAVELGALLDARAQFRELVGQEPQGLDWPQKGGVTAGLRTPQALEAAVSEAPFLLQAQAAVDVAQAERAEARAALRPQLRLEGSLLRREIGRRMEEDAVIALRLRLDAFQGLSSLRRVDAASRRIEAAGFNVQDARRALRRVLRIRAGPPRCRPTRGRPRRPTRWAADADGAARCRPRSGGSVSRAVRNRHAQHRRSLAGAARAVRSRAAARRPREQPHPRRVPGREPARPAGRAARAHRRQFRRRRRWLVSP